LAPSAAHGRPGAIVRMGSNRPAAPVKPVAEAKAPQITAEEAKKPAETSNSAPENASPSATEPQQETVFFVFFL